MGRSENRKRAFLALEDGKVFSGWSFGSTRDAVGEIVFNTSMTGYQEILTDPSYKRQIVTMTYPMIGNYGINDEDMESIRPQVEGFVVKENCTYPSNWRSRRPLEEYLATNDIPGICGVDTRALTKHIRSAGAMRAVLSSSGSDRTTLVGRAKAWHGLVGKDMVQEVTCREIYTWSPNERLPLWWHRRMPSSGSSKGDPFRVVALDCGIKRNILRILASFGCTVAVVPARTSAQEILSMKPEGVFLSNGPGDPAAVTYAIDTIRSLLGRVPIFGICLGHQLLGLALGARTFKMKFGHRGANHPVKEVATGRVHITTQNHGFCVDMKSLDPDLIEITHVNLNDHTLEGFSHKHCQAYSVQHHPEASAGPHESISIYKRFIDWMSTNREHPRPQGTTEHASPERHP